MTKGIKKHERLKSRKLITELFANGKIHKAFPVIAIYLPLQDSESIKVGFSVPKKRIKLAKDRNTLKRRMREAFRIERGEKDIHLVGMAVMFIYVKNEPSEYSVFEKSMGRLLEKLKTDQST